jgi:hypothetical protein
MMTGKKFEGNKGEEILEEDENILPPPTYIEIDNVITNLELKKAPGTENTPSVAGRAWKQRKHCFRKGKKSYIHVNNSI